MPGFLVNYRSSDAAAYAALIHEALAAHFGDEQVSMDVDTIEPGLDWMDAIERSVAGNDAVVVVIGRHWVVDESGRRRLDDPHDYVRLEIEAALAQDIRIVPVLVDGAAMPSSDDLPESLRPLVQRRAVALQRAGAGAEIEDLLHALDRVVAPPASEPPRPASVAPPPPPVAAPPPPLRRPVFPAWPFRRRSKAARGLAVPELGRKVDAAPSEPARGASTADGDTVECTVFAPPAAAPGETIFVQLFAHLVEQAAAAHELAETFDEAAERRAVRTLEEVVRRGTRLTFEVHLGRVAVAEPVQSLVWAGRPESVQFAAAVPKGAEAGTVIGTVTVSVGSVPVGHVRFKLDVRSRRARRATEPEPVGDDAARYATAFVSYASRDRRQVLERVQMLQSVGITTFQDVLDLDPGDRWERQLYRRIDECDLFLLFWSTNARESEWVRREARCALDRQGGDELAPPAIRPVIIEGPPIPAPWPELSHLHFGDRVAYVLAGLS